MNLDNHVWLIVDLQARINDLAIDAGEKAQVKRRLDELQKRYNAFEEMLNPVRLVIKEIEAQQAAMAKLANLTQPTVRSP